MFKVAIVMFAVMGVVVTMASRLVCWPFEMITVPSDQDAFVD